MTDSFGTEATARLYRRPEINGQLFRLWCPISFSLNSSWTGSSAVAFNSNMPSISWTNACGGFSFYLVDVTSMRVSRAQAAVSSTVTALLFLSSLVRSWPCWAPRVVQAESFTRAHQ
jgi:hypothetical protein